MAATTGPFLSTLQSNPHEFLQPTLPLYTDSIAYLKNILDPLAKDVSEEQQQRLKEARRKRKRGQDHDEEDVLRLKQIHTEGFGVEQVWEQARRVIDAATHEAEKAYEAAAAQAEGEEKPATNGKSVKFADEEEESDEDLGEEGVDYEVEGVDDGEEEYDEEDEEDEENADQVLSDDEEDFDMNGHDDFDDMEEDEEERDEPAAELVQDKFGLNDGFFSIDDFNKQSEFLEQQDARGDDDGAASDEEDVDWDADPLGQGAVNGDATAGADEEDGEEEEDGPTFGDPDAPSEDEDEEVDGGEMDGLGDMANTNDVMYADFFAPPAQKKKKNKKGRPNPHNFPETSANGKQDDEPDMQRTMEAVHRDLFDESDEEEGEEEKEELDPADPRSRRSAHERRKAEIAAEIRKLEAANVAKREWQLSGEARAADRPVNSLLEEDLDFERAGKPVPVITAEVSESIEELVKRRILAHDFQDIIRRRPDDLATGKDGRRGKLDFELDDSKSKKGLAEEYEEEHLKRTDPNYVDVKDEKLEKEQKEIEKLWREVSGQLDSLSSWHFRPKAPAPQLDIRVDAPVVTMEDARPNAGGEVAGASQLAPQEIYKGGEASAANKREEVAGKSGLPSAREEMSREEKKRRRRREKERIRKASGNADGKNVESRAAKEKKAMLGDLKKGGVKVIGKKGDMRDVEGKEVRGGDGSGGQGAARFKL
ncbi:hypothetical protein PRZ48_012703 [Zasmidium cellare]|uniref:U3 small nucleolar ribonucleoprotein protein MPP10 n=1 Tax=Zasmidium cellare TaxID=395010 RepID=A0ABR0E653_ZASCE|nr:hypothetical protein PRZ48_012703 [Zasmidium cellare]